jgi:hypothetical protein
MAETINCRVELLVLLGGVLAEIEAHAGPGQDTITKMSKLRVNCHELFESCAQDTNVAHEVCKITLLLSSGRV